MGTKKITRRSTIKPFVKVINYSHIMPTRYTLDADLKAMVTPDAATNPTARKTSTKRCKKVLEARYAQALRSGKSKWFFTKLRF